METGAAGHHGQLVASAVTQEHRHGSASVMTQNRNMAVKRVQARGLRRESATCSLVLEVRLKIADPDRRYSKYLLLLLGKLRDSRDVNVIGFSDPVDLWVIQ